MQRLQVGARHAAGRNFRFNLPGKRYQQRCFRFLVPLRAGRSSWRKRGFRRAKRKVAEAAKRRYTVRLALAETPSLPYRHAAQNVSAYIRMVYSAQACV